jgi:hypothetical protein
MTRRQILTTTLALALALLTLAAAQQIFPNTILAKEGQTIVLPVITSSAKH